MKLDKRACRHAANAPLNISLNAGVLYTERVKCLVTAAVKLLGGHRALAVYFYECERLKANDRMPKWVVFQGKDDFATLERDAEGNVKWRDSMLENLVDESFYKFRESCVFYKGTDGVTISDFINQSASGITILEALQVYQYGMGDAVSMIFFTVSDEYTQDFHTAPRITREMFCYKDNVLLQSRLYPTDLEDQKTLYRSIVQQAIATCLDKPNLWSLKRGKDTEPYCESAADSNHYPDYKYGYAVASLLKGENDYGQMTIGSVARCVCCGGEQKNHRSIRCAECGNMYVCKGCGKTVHGYGRYIDEHFYCNECSYECAVCKEKFIGMPRIGIARSGEQRGICPACYAQVVDVCGNCTIHSDCLSIGANRFCPNQMSGLAA